MNCDCWISIHFGVSVFQDSLLLIIIMVDVSKNAS